MSGPKISESEHEIALHGEQPVVEKRTVPKGARAPRQGRADRGGGGQRGPSARADRARGRRRATLGVAGPDRTSYGPGGWLDLPRLLRPHEVAPDDVFLDIGAGKGRIVLVAAQYRFARVIGVEVSEHLVSVARRNVETCRLRPRSEIELVNEDIADYRVPDDVSVVYMFNPFRGALFDLVIRRLIASVDRAPRPLRLIYRNAVEHERLMRTGRFRPFRRALAPRPTRAWMRRAAVRFYVLEPATS